MIISGILMFPGCINYNYKQAIVSYARTLLTLIMRPTNHVRSHLRTDLTFSSVHPG